MRMRERVLRGDYLIGTHISTGDFITADILARCGYDFIWIDTEHSCMDYRTLLSCISVIRARGVPVIVRAQTGNHAHTKRILEMGVDGIIFPNIGSEQEARAAIASCLYPPDGVRGFGPLGAADYGLRDTSGYIRESGEELAIFLQIESAEAVDILPQLCALPHADGFILGPCDLSGSLGRLGEITSDVNMREVRRMMAVLREKKKYAGISIGSTEAEDQDFWLREGFRLISSGTDYDYLCRGAAANARQLRARIAAGHDGQGGRGI